MRCSLRSLSLFLLVTLASLSALAQAPPQVGDTLELKATHHDGVPLHNRPQPTDDFQRVPDGSRASLLELRENGRWHRIRVLPGGPEGWIVAKYILRVVPGAGPGGGVVPAGAGEREAEVWASAASCEAALAAGARMGRELASPLVVGAWNIRWFPRGCPRQEDCPENATDLDWLACSIAWMGLDVLGVEEILDTGDARVALATLSSKLDALTGGSWESDLHDCGAPEDQHVGFLWNAERVTVANASDEEQLNGAYDGVNPCAANLRPGRYARVSSRQAGGADFHLLVLHLDSGTAERDFSNRRSAIAEIPHLRLGNRLLTEIGDPQDPAGQGDNDILLLGDWNTMGRRVPPAVSEEEEIDLFDEELAPGFRRLPPSRACTEYFRPQGEAQFRGGLLDHGVAAQGMEEVAPRGRVSGYCAVQACQPFTQAPAAYQRLSDHCPLVVEVLDQDVED